MLIPFQAVMIPLISLFGKAHIRMFFFFGEYTKQWHLALAGLTLAIIPIIVFYMLVQRHIIKGVKNGEKKLAFFY